MCCTNEPTRAFTSTWTCVVVSFTVFVVFQYNISGSGAFGFGLKNVVILADICAGVALVTFWVTG